MKKQLLLLLTITSCFGAPTDEELLIYRGSHTEVMGIQKELAESLLIERLEGEEREEGNEYSFLIRLPHHGCMESNMQNNQNVLNGMCVNKAKLTLNSNGQYRVIPLQILEMDIKTESVSAEDCKKLEDLDPDGSKMQSYLKKLVLAKQYGKTEAELHKASTTSGKDKDVKGANQQEKKQFLSKAEPDFNGSDTQQRVVDTQPNIIPTKEQLVERSSSGDDHNRDIEDSDAFASEKGVGGYDKLPTLEECIDCWKRVLTGLGLIKNHDKID